MHWPELGSCLKSCSKKQSSLQLDPGHRRASTPHAVIAGFACSPDVSTGSLATLFMQLGSASLISRASMRQIIPRASALKKPTTFYLEAISSLKLKLFLLSKNAQRFLLGGFSKNTCPEQSPSPTGKLIKSPPSHILKQSKNPNNFIRTKLGKYQPMEGKKKKRKRRQANDSLKKTKKRLDLTFTFFFYYFSFFYKHQLPLACSIPETEVNRIKPGQLDW